MHNPQTELSDVIYNAAEQAFEAKITIHDGDTSRSYACAISAPITMSFEEAAEGLTKQALRRHGKPNGLRSTVTSARQRLVTRILQVKPRRGLPVGQYGFFRGRAA